jgi:hypothetical protein
MHKAPVRKERIPLGIAYMIAATVLFAGSSATSKWLVATYPVGEVLFSRSATSLVGASLVILPYTALRCFAPSACAPISCAAYRKAVRRRFC